MITPTTPASPDSVEREELKPCPFCGAGETQIVENGKIWTGMKYSEPTSVSVRHHCEPTKGQPSRMLERVGKDRESAIAAWNTRAMLAATPAREWVGLTGDELLSAAKNSGLSWHIGRDVLEHFARAVEAKLKEKNGY